jgi:hypothetical protein
MSKSLRKSNLHIGQLVTTSDSPEAQVRTVSHIFDNNMVELQWHEADQLIVQGIDRSMLYAPTIQQIEYSIQFNGRLVSINDILELA